MMTDWRREPVMWLVAGGTTGVQAFMQLLIAFNVPITSAQQAAVTSFVGVIVALLARMQVTPMSSLPAGVAGEIADAKAARAVSRDLGA